ncbi:MAG: hypothetical protein ACLQIB_27960 [Isosphaeraceae bacterium]
MDEPLGPTPTLNADIETEVKELMGLFDLPAFARRGQEVEHSQERLHERCRAMRGDLLDMVRMRLRQWASSVTGPDAWRRIFTASIEPLWDLSDAEAPRWAPSAAPSRRQIAIARDLIAAVLRFNTRWARCLDQVNLDPVNHAIERYNRYYVLEKECVVGSARIAARHFVPVARIDRETLLRSHPALPVPELLVQSRDAGRVSS